MTRLAMSQTTACSALRHAGTPLFARLCFAVGAALALAAAAAPAAATLYKWVDANGRVVYSDQPPPSNVQSEVVKPPPPPANPNAAKEFEDKDAAIKQRDRKRVEDTKAAEQTRQTTERRREACANALGQLRALQQKGENLYRFNDKGEKVYYNDDMRRDEADRQQQIIRENCPG